MSRGTSRTRRAAEPRGHVTPELFRFLRRLRRNNRREWFEEHRGEYLEHVRDPLLAFIGDLAPRLRRISPHVVADPRPTGGSMFRIHRDVRFSKDKSPYKTMAAAQFRHEAKRDVHAPGYYLHLAPGEVFFGAGLWHPDTASLTRIRRAIVERPRRWTRILAAKTFREGLCLGGASLKRAPLGFDPGHPLIEDLRRRDFVTTLELDEEAACARDFQDRFLGFCRDSRPFLRFLTEALGLPF